MSVIFKKGDLLESNCDYICHQVNCMGAMNSGIAKQIREKWPIVYDEYVARCNKTHEEAIELYGCYEMSPEGSDFLLGSIQFVNINTPGADERARFVINLFAQQYYGYDGLRYTSYDAFWSCLDRIKNYVPIGSTIGFPKNIGCGLGSANWPVILTMITEVLGKDYSVYIFHLEDDE